MISKGRKLGENTTFRTLKSDGQIMLVVKPKIVQNRQEIFILTITEYYQMNNKLLKMKYSYK